MRSKCNVKGHCDNRYTMEPCRGHWYFAEENQIECSLLYNLAAHAPNVAPFASCIMHMHYRHDHSSSLFHLRYHRLRFISCFLGELG